LINLQEKNSEESLVQCVHCPNALCISANQAADQVDQLINFLCISPNQSADQVDQLIDLLTLSNPYLYLNGHSVNPPSLPPTHKTITNPPPSPTTPCQRNHKVLV